MLRGHQRHLLQGSSVQTGQRCGTAGAARPGRDPQLLAGEIMSLLTSGIAGSRPDGPCRTRSAIAGSVLRANPGLRGCRRQIYAGESRVWPRKAGQAPTPSSGPFPMPWDTHTEPFTSLSPAGRAVSLMFSHLPVPSLLLGALGSHFMLA